jgi:hypothetical protein
MKLSFVSRRARYRKKKGDLVWMRVLFDKEMDRIRSKKGRV